MHRCSSLQLIAFWHLKIIRSRLFMFDQKKAPAIGHFWVHFGLYFKTSLRVNSLLQISVFIHIEIRTNYHNKNFARRLTLKERLRGDSEMNCWLLMTLCTSLILVIAFIYLFNHKPMTKKKKKSAFNMKFCSLRPRPQSSVLSHLGHYSRSHHNTCILSRR